jgi:hypothetical protein
LARPGTSTVPIVCLPVRLDWGRYNINRASGV